MPNPISDVLPPPLDETASIQADSFIRIQWGTDKGGWQSRDFFDLDDARAFWREKVGKVQRIFADKMTFMPKSGDPAPVQNARGERYIEEPDVYERHWKTDASGPEVVVNEHGDWDVSWRGPDTADDAAEQQVDNTADTHGRYMEPLLDEGYDRDW